MNTHQRNVPATIDPTKLERLAETAVKVGVSLQPGQDLFLTAPVAALPLARLIARQAYKGGAGLVTPILSDDEMTLARFRLRLTQASTSRPAGSTMASPRLSPPIQRGSPSSAKTRCCSRRRTPPRSRAPTRPTRSPISRHWKRSPASTSTGTLSPIRLSPGQSASFPAKRTTSPSANSPRRSSLLRGSTATIRSRPGPSTIRSSVAGGIG